LLLKNERGSTLLWLFPVRLVLDGIAGLQALLKGKWRETGTIIKAHFHFYRKLGFWAWRRRENKKYITNRNETGLYRHSIIKDYFISNRKKFPQLNWKPKPLK
jgi:hypothetical protein